VTTNYEQAVKQVAEVTRSGENLPGLNYAI
jgi:hypothetical protein